MSSPRNTGNSSQRTEPTSRTSDDTNLDEPSTSAGIKAHYAINTNINSGKSKITLTDDDSLTSLDELALQLLRERSNIENDSFISAADCREETATTTENTAPFNRNEQIQNVVTVRSSVPNYLPPPPYDPQDNVSSTRERPPRYQEIYMVQPQIPMSQDANRRPFRRFYADVNINDMLDAFDSTKVKNQFVQKVYIVLSTQLLLIFGIIIFCKNEKNTRHFVEQDHIWYKVSLAIFIVSYMVLVRYQRIRRRFPLNITLFILFTLSLAYLAAAITCFYKTQILLISVGVSAGICLLVSLLGFQQAFELMECPMPLGLLYLIVLIYFLIAIVDSIKLSDPDISYLTYSCIVTLAFVMYLMYDTQKILAGQRIQILPEDYILGAIQLYVDILLTFIGLICMYRNS